MNKKAAFILGIIGFSLFAGCVSGPPQGLEPVTGFELDRYLGTWYEIARLDHSFERNLSHVTAEYDSCQCPARITIINRGYNEKKKKWQTVCGSAQFIGPHDRAALKVSFFRPFYAPYYVIALDKENYQWAMVTSAGRDYLWILARTPELEEPTLSRLLDQADQWGFAADALIFPVHR